MKKHLVIFVWFSVTLMTDADAVTASCSELPRMSSVADKLHGAFPIIHNRSDAVLLHAVRASCGVENTDSTQ